jgi:ribosome-associated protein
MPLIVTPAIAIPDESLEERFIRASGPGGQNVNKVATAVELRFNVAASSLPDRVKQRLVLLAGSRMSADGVLLIDSRAHRTQAQNREAARERLVELLQEAAKRPKARRPTKPTKASREQRLESKTIRARIKRTRRPTGGDD